MTPVPMMPTTVATSVQQQSTSPCGTAVPEISAPVSGGRAIIGVEGVDAVIRGRDINDIVRATADAHSLKVERLRVHVAIDVFLEEFSKGILVDVGGRERGFTGVEAGAAIVAVLRGDIHGQHGCSGEKKTRRHGGSRRALSRGKLPIISMRSTVKGVGTATYIRSGGDTQGRFWQQRQFAASPTNRPESLMRGIVTRASLQGRVGSAGIRFWGRPDGPAQSVLRLVVLGHRGDIIETRPCEILLGLDGFEDDADPKFTAFPRKLESLLRGRQLGVGRSRVG